MGFEIEREERKLMKGRRYFGIFLCGGEKLRKEKKRKGKGKKKKNDGGINLKTRKKGKYLGKTPELRKIPKTLEKLEK